MRTIKFRGKSIGGNDWVYGYLGQERGVSCDCYCLGIANGEYFIEDWLEKIDTGVYGVRYKVIPETVGQFVNLDKNKREMYEGDIVEYDNGMVKERFVIVYSEEWARFLFMRRTNETYSVFRPENCEVIGNIYENPELLKEAGKDGAQSAAQDVLAPAT